MWAKWLFLSLLIEPSAGAGVSIPTLQKREAQGRGLVRPGFKLYPSTHHLGWPGSVAPFIASLT